MSPVAENNATPSRTRTGDDDDDDNTSAETKMDSPLLLWWEIPHTYLHIDMMHTGATSAI